MPTKKRILSISYDAAINRTRQYILEEAGYGVTSAIGFTDAAEKAKHGDYDLLILGHTVVRKDKVPLINLAREYCKSPILSIYRSDQGPLKEADYHVDSNEGPLALLEVVKLALEKSA